MLFGNPDKASAQLSPNGKYLSFLAPVEGVLNVWVGPAATPDSAAPVTHDRGRGIRAYGWAYTNRHITYIQDRAGDENWHCSGHAGKNIPVTYVLYPDEGHGFARPENALSFMAVSEAFLSACLGGRHQPIGEDLSGSSITMPQGREHVPGLAEARP